MYYVYILKSEKSGQLYTGVTNDLRKRLSQHNLGQSTFTKKGVPWELIYYEASLNEDDAHTREKYLKSGPGKAYLKNRLKRFLTLTG
ncbi:MAG: GIY-YIG nuclease family protein [Candidatus Paceibacterota bacterium]